jgi:acid phosphatase (class A)
MYSTARILSDRWLILLGLCLLVAGCETTKPNKGLEDVPEIRPGVLQGYLAMESLPDSLALLPPAPEAGSATSKVDIATSKWALGLRDTARWDLAIADAELLFPEAASTFSCAMNIPMSESNTPHLYRLLRRTLPDLGLSTYGAKRHFARERPFAENGQPICTPEQRELLVKDGSYPSGHSAIGWGWALILSEIAPERANEVLSRGMAFTESRMVCNVHWASDVAAGRTMGAATVARLHAEPAFQINLAGAKKEYEAVRESGRAPQGNCQKEKETIEQFPSPRL